MKLFDESTMSPINPKDDNDEKERKKIYSKTFRQVEKFFFPNQFETVR